MVSENPFRYKSLNWRNFVLVRFVYLGIIFLKVKLEYVLKIVLEWKTKGWEACKIYIAGL